MGLREKKEVQTREKIFKVALRSFVKPVKFVLKNVRVDLFPKKGKLRFVAIKDMN